MTSTTPRRVGGVRGSWDGVGVGVVAGAGVGVGFGLGVSGVGVALSHDMEPNKSPVEGFSFGDSFLGSILIIQGMY